MPNGMRQKILHNWFLLMPNVYLDRFSLGIRRNQLCNIISHDGSNMVVDGIMIFFRP
jgi:hypothetical protein